MALKRYLRIHHFTGAHLRLWSNLITLGHLDAWVLLKLIARKLAFFFNGNVHLGLVREAAIGFICWWTCYEIITAVFMLLEGTL